ncbi:Acg family FMN-binding oxidoreductase [Actinoplanes sp. NPDC051513]|uniref:Acg family FMN-binding oxidoreductase n=1 Tax=Actinoplanes sp. NPDC051513 TaxID=3363908 RepID=UPI00379E68E2
MNSLVDVVRFAGLAPSLHNSQPWRWRVASERALELFLERRRVLPATDPDGRLAVLSCGAGLHHASLQRAADIARLPDQDDPDLLARLTLRDGVPVDVDSARLAEAALWRRTDRRVTLGESVDLHRVRSVRAAVLARGADLSVVRPDQIFELAAAASAAVESEAAESAWRDEAAVWVGGSRVSGVGVPSSALPPGLPTGLPPGLLSGLPPGLLSGLPPGLLSGLPPDTAITLPALALRKAEAAEIRGSLRRAWVFAVLHTTGDTRLDWLIAGEALSAGWLTATDLGLGVLPLSVVTEVARSRDRIRKLLGWAGYPHLVLRFAAAGVATAPATPRLPLEGIVRR